MPSVPASAIWDPAGVMSQSRSGPTGNLGFPADEEEADSPEGIEAAWQLPEAPLAFGSGVIRPGIVHRWGSPQAGA